MRRLISRIDLRAPGRLRWPDLKKRLWGLDRTVISTTAVAITLLTFVLAGLSGPLINMPSLQNPDTLARLTTVMSGYRPPLAVTIIDVDDASLSEWDSSGSTPRDRLARFIETARSRGARGIIVDLDLSAIEDPKRDPSLVGVLESHPADGAPLFLVRRFSPSPQSGRATFEATPYDDTVSNKPGLFWVTSVFSHDDDLAIRRFAMAQAVCTPGGAEALLSAPLAVAAYEAGRAQAFAARLADINRRVSQACRSETADPSWRARIDELSNQVRAPYAFAWSEGVTPAGHGARGFASLSDSLITVPARHLTGSAEIAATPFAGRYVIIGATHRNSRDLYRTPLGLLPGVVILANTVAAAPDLVRASSWSGAAGYALSILCFLIFAGIGLYVRGAAMVALIGISAAIMAVVLSRLILPSVAIDVIARALVLLAAQLFLTSLGMIVSDLRAGKGWQAILHPRSN